MQETDPARRGSNVRGIVKPDREVSVVPAGQAKREEYRIILPRQDAVGWRMARVLGPETRLEILSPEMCGSQSLRISVVTLAPGVHDSAHWHASGEKALYVIKGRGRIYWGEGIPNATDIGPGDCVYVPPGAVHAPANTGDEPLELLMLGNAPYDVTVPGGEPSVTGDTPEASPRSQREGSIMDNDGDRLRAKGGTEEVRPEYT